MYYSKLECMDDCGAGLGQLTPSGQDCAEINRIYKREQKNFKTRSGEHKKRAKANMERFQEAYNQCQNQPAHRIVPAAGGVPEDTSGLTPERVESLVAASSTVSGEPLDYSKIGLSVLALVVVLGGVIWLTKPKEKK